MIEILSVPQPDINEFVQPLEQRGIAWRVTKKIPKRRWWRGNWFGGNVYYAPNINPEIVKQALEEVLTSTNPVVINGTGDFHHLTYGVCARLKEPFGYIHIDNHADFGDKNDEFINMGAFVDYLLTNTHANGGLLIGCNNTYKKKCPILSYNECHTIKKQLPQYLEQLPQQVYVSVDLDVLTPETFTSGYESGQLTPEILFNILDMICEKKTLVGGDICGYAGNDPPSLEIAIETIVKIHTATER